MGSIAFLIISDNPGNILYGVLKGFIPKNGCAGKPVEAGRKLSGGEPGCNRGPFELEKKSPGECLDVFQYPGNITVFVMEVLLACFKSVMALMSVPRERHSPFPA